MSYDIVFLPPSARDDWAGAMDTLEIHAMMGAEATDEDLAAWDRLDAALTGGDLVFERVDSEDARSYLGCHPTIEIELRPGDVRIGVPYTTDALDTVGEILPRVVRLTEEATGRVAYDPQSDRAYFDPDNDPTRVITCVRDFLASKDEEDAHAHDRGPRGLRRLFGRRGAAD